MRKKGREGETKCAMSERERAKEEENCQKQNNFAMCVAKAKPAFNLNQHGAQQRIHFPNRHIK